MRLLSLVRVEREERGVVVPRIKCVQMQWYVCTDVAGAETVDSLVGSDIVATGVKACKD